MLKPIIALVAGALYTKAEQISEFKSQNFLSKQSVESEIAEAVGLFDSLMQELGEEEYTALAADLSQMNEK